MDSPQSDGLLKGQVAVITGAARGIGAAIARSFAEHGAQLVLNDLGCDRHGLGSDATQLNELAQQLTGAGHSVLTHPGDISAEDQVEQLFAQAEQRFGRVDILVNNAGIIADKSLFDLEVQDWDRVISVHLRGTFLCTRAFARLCRKKRQGGSILNMTGVSGMLGNLGQLNESTSKAGIYGLTRTASIELQRFRIRVNALAPIARTRLTEDLPMFEKVSGTMEAEHIAPAAVFLASSLSEDLSGTVLSVAGGRLSCFELAESQGRIKEADDGLWTPQQIAEHYESIARR
jgi:NAD(P)-dependent dehydrogenase (short-subunit alcohol dehydrogenase family)